MTRSADACRCAAAVALEAACAYMQVQAAAALRRRSWRPRTLARKHRSQGRRQTGTTATASGTAHGRALAAHNANSPMVIVCRHTPGSDNPAGMLCAPDLSLACLVLRPIYTQFLHVNSRSLYWDPPARGTRSGPRRTAAGSPSASAKIKHNTQEGGSWIPRNACGG